VGNPENAVALLLAENELEAQKFAVILDTANKNRQMEEQEIYDEAMAMLASDPAYENEKVLVLAHADWHHGIIGIVSSKITERFNKPCILISLSDGIGKGSGRSIKHFNLFNALTACGEHLTRFGGHELAAGLTLWADNVAAFRHAINEYADSVMQEEDSLPELMIDAELPLPYMTLHTVDKLSVMAPYGMGNPNPVFVCRNLLITGMRLLSEGKHIRLNLSDGNTVINAIGFSMGELYDSLQMHEKIDIVFTLDSNMYKGERQVQVLLKDIRHSISC